MTTDIERLREALKCVQREYDTEYDGRTYTHCTACNAQLSEKEKHTANCAWLRIDAALESTISQPAVGDGWKIVPVEPGIVSILEEIEKQMEHSLDCYCLPLWPEEAAVIVRIARAMLSAAPVIPERPSTDAPVVSVLEMKTSAGPEYFSSIRCGVRQLEIHKHKIKGRAEFEVAEFQWLLNGGEKPNMLDWLDRTDDPASKRPSEAP